MCKEKSDTASLTYHFTVPVFRSSLMNSLDIWRGWLCGAKPAAALNTDKRIANFMVNYLGKAVAVVVSWYHPLPTKPVGRGWCLVACCGRFRASPPNVCGLTNKKKGYYWGVCPPFIFRQESSQLFKTTPMVLLKKIFKIEVHDNRSPKSQKTASKQ